MIAPPEIIQSNAVEAAVISITCKREDMPKVFGPAVQELFGMLGAQGIESIGAVFAHHLTMPPGMFNFELGVVVTLPVKPMGRVVPGGLPVGRVARTVYTGPYEGLHGAWGEFDAWLQAGQHQRAGGLWEVYVHGPDKTPNPAEWRTELNRPLAG
ncbi:MAG: AraC family transcriptional regulator [Rhizobiales bacterium PAR1]|nr:MAG: AraC family transcriptional regulator [Rhizobiales bacterium PAR1]